MSSPPFDPLTGLFVQPDFGPSVAAVIRRRIAQAQVGYQPSTTPTTYGRLEHFARYLDGVEETHPLMALLYTTASSLGCLDHDGHLVHLGPGQVRVLEALENPEPPPFDELFAALAAGGYNDERMAVAHRHKHDLEHRDAEPLPDIRVRRLVGVKDNLTDPELEVEQKAFAERKAARNREGEV